MFEQIGLRVQNMLTILELIINIIGQDVYDQLMSTGDLLFDTE